MGIFVSHGNISDNGDDDDHDDDHDHIHSPKVMIATFQVKTS